MRRFKEFNIKKIIEDITNYSNGTIIDFHTHPNSFDTKGNFSLEDIIEHLDKINVDYICETDHNRYPKYDNERIIKGCEVSTKKGHISIISENQDLEDFINKYIKNEKKKLETSAVFEYAKKDKESLIILPHAFQPGGYFYNSLRDRRVRYVKKNGIFLEWTNSRRSPDSKAAHLLNQTSESYSIPVLGGSDAHSIETFGMAGIYLPKKIDAKNQPLKKILKNEDEWLIYHVAQDDTTYNLYLLDNYARKYARLCFAIETENRNKE